MSPRSWIVDGYNVLRVSLTESPATSGPGDGGSEDWWGETSRARLAAIASRLPYPEDEIILVYDARHLEQATSETSEAYGRRLSRVFAPSADDWIVAAVKQRDDPQQAVVVTADRPLGDRARHHGARVMSSREFVELCGAAEGRRG